MFYNLQNVLIENGYNLKFLADFLNVTEKTIQNKIRGYTDFSYSEFKKICGLLPKYDADYLFSTECKKTA